MLQSPPGSTFCVSEKDEKLHLNRLRLGLPDILVEEKSSLYTCGISPYSVCGREEDFTIAVQFYLLGLMRKRRCLQVCTVLSAQLLLFCKNTKSNWIFYSNLVNVGSWQWNIVDIKTTTRIAYLNWFWLQIVTLGNSKLVTYFTSTPTLVLRW